MFEFYEFYNFMFYDVVCELEVEFVIGLWEVGYVVW